MTLYDDIVHSFFDEFLFQLGGNNDKKFLANNFLIFIYCDIIISILWNLKNLKR